MQSKRTPPRPRPEAYSAPVSPLVPGEPPAPGAAKRRTSTQTWVISAFVWAMLLAVFLGAGDGPAVFATAFVGWLVWALWGPELR
jgi:hypothetical protein